MKTSLDGTYEKNVQAMLDVLQKKHGLPLPPEDVAGVTTLYHTFYWCGPSINYGVTAGATSCASGRVTWADLMMRAIATYLRSHDATVSAFYVSNVEQYLQRNGVWIARRARVAFGLSSGSHVFD